jgi:hypothetical protein
VKEVSVNRQKLAPRYSDRLKDGKKQRCFLDRGDRIRRCRRLQVLLPAIDNVQSSRPMETRYLEIATRWEKRQQHALSGWKNSSLFVLPHGVFGYLRQRLFGCCKSYRQSRHAIYLKLSRVDALRNLANSGNRAHAIASHQAQVAAGGLFRHATMTSTSQMLRTPHNAGRHGKILRACVLS